MYRVGLLLLLCVWSAVAAPVARADELQDRFDTVWESLWYQGGTPLPVSRWSGEIRVRVQGRNVSTHRERILEALRTVAREADITVVDVTDGGAGAASPNLEVRVVNDGEGPPNMACFVRTTERDGQRIKAQELSMRQGSVYRCALQHEDRLSHRARSVPFSANRWRHLCCNVVQVLDCDGHEVAGGTSCCG